MLALILFAADDPQDKSALGGMGLPLIMMAVFALFYFLIALPAQRRDRKQREDLFAKLKKNDEVVLASGIIGIVHTLREGDEDITLKLEGDAKMRVQRQAIAQIRPSKSETSSEGIVEFGAKK